MKNKTVTFLLVIIMSFSSTSFCNASSLFDDFNNYNDGSLVGQGGWKANENLVYDINIQSDVTNEGSKAVAITKASSGGNGIFKTGNLGTDGIMTFYFRFTNNGRAFISLGLQDDLRGGLVGVFSVMINDDGINGEIKFFNLSSGLFTTFGKVSADKWHFFQIQWRSSDHKARYNVDGGQWTDYFSGPGSWTSGGLSSVNVIGANIGNESSFYFDTFQENLVTHKVNPVLIVPGLLGTELFDGSEKLWIDVSRMLTDIGDEFIDSLQFKKDLMPIDGNVYYGEVISKDLTFDYTEGLINELKIQGYKEGNDSDANLFTFPYDWRYGVSGKFADGKTNVDLLKQKVKDIKEQTGSAKVDVVAHSLGGLLVKKYVMENTADHNIGKAVFVGVPNAGAPKAVKTLLQGDNLGMFFLSQKKIKEIAENMPSIYDLLPSQQYYDVKGSFVQTIDYGNIFDLSSGLPDVKINDLDYEEFKSFLTDSHQLNPTALTGAVTLHDQTFDNFDLRTTGVDLYSINGCRAGTITKITETKSVNILGQELIDYKAIKLGAGDNTVPFESATNLPVDQNNKYYALAADHSKMLSQDGIRQQIVKILSGGVEASDAVITQDIEKCKLNGKAISVFSPVDIFATDQNGNRLGLAQDQSIINEIPNAAFEIMGEHKFIYLPMDSGQTYNINITGKAEGIFTIKVQGISNDEIIKTEVFSNLPATESLEGNINIGNSPDDPTALVVHQNPADPPLTIFPLSNVNSEQSEDLLPPVLLATIRGDAGQNNFYRSNVVINLKAADRIIAGKENQTSGVLNISYKLDNLEEKRIEGDSASIDVLGEGKHAIVFFSTDKAGSNEQKHKITFIIDKTAPEAEIKFDPIAQNLKFSGIDNLAESSLLEVVKENDVVAISDLAGNFTEIGIKRKAIKDKISAEVISLKYNGISADMSKNKMIFKWHYDKNKNLKMLSQYAKSKNGYNVIAVYDGEKTKIFGKDSSGKIFQIADGLKLIKITTQNGNLYWSY